MKNSKLKKSLYIALAGIVLFTGLFGARSVAATELSTAREVTAESSKAFLPANQNIHPNSLPVSSNNTVSSDALAAAFSENRADGYEIDDMAEAAFVSENTTSGEDPVSFLSGNTVIVSSFNRVIQVGGFPKERSATEEAAGSENPALESLIVDAVDNWEGSPEIKIDLTGQGYFDHESLFDSVDMVINNHPEFFILSGKKSVTVSGNSIIGLTLQTDPDYTIQDEAAFDNKVNSILQNVNPSWTDLQKAIYIHDWVVTNVQYDVAYEKSTAYDAIVDGSSVCQGYSLAYAYLMNCVSPEFSCDVVISWYENHAWNTLFLDGKRYYVDCTFDDSGDQHMYKAYCDHDYCVVSRSRIIESRSYPDWVDSSGNNIYNAATGNLYDNACWIKSESKIPMIDNVGASIVPDEDYSFRTCVYLCDFKTGTESRIFPDASIGFSFLYDMSSADVIGNYFAISALHTIYLIDMTGAIIDKYEQTDDEKAMGMFFGIEASNGIITYYIQTEYLYSSLVKKGKLDWSRYDSPAAVTGIKLDESSLLMSIGDKHTLNATISPHNAFNQNVTWQSSVPSVVSVNSSGIIYGLKTGEAEITVNTEEGGFSDVCQVTVLEHMPPSEDTETCRVRFISGTSVIAETDVNKGDIIDRSNITRNIDLEDDKNSIFRGWYEDNNTLWNETAPVMHDMDLYSNFIPVTSSDKSDSGKDLYLNPRNGDTLYLVKGVRYFLNPDKSYTSSDKKTVKISGKNKIKAQKEGSAQLSDQNGSTYPAIVIKPVLSPKKLTLLTGSEESLTLDLGGYEDKYNITWESSNDTVARVSGGKVTGIAKGNTVISAYVGGKAFKCRVTVKAAYSNPARVKDGDHIKLAPSQSYKLLYEDESFSFKNVSWTANMKLKTFYKNKKAVRFETPVVSISSAGKVTAVGEGSILLTATDTEGHSKYLTVTVSSPEKKIIYVGTGKYKTVAFQGLKAGATTLRLDSSDIAVVRKRSFLGLSPGSTTFNASYTPKTSSKLAAGYTLKGTLYVESMSFTSRGSYVVVPVSGKSNRVYDLSINNDMVRKLNIKGVYGNIKWTTNNPQIAFIDESGVIYSRNPGRAKFTTTVGGNKYTLNITVYE